MEGERSYKLQGLGHLENPFCNSVEDWQTEIWQDILRLYYGQVTKRNIYEKVVYLLCNFQAYYYNSQSLEQIQNEIFGKNL